MEKTNPPQPAGDDSPLWNGTSCSTPGTSACWGRVGIPSSVLGLDAALSIQKPRLSSCFLDHKHRVLLAGQEAFPCQQDLFHAFFPHSLWGLWPELLSLTEASATLELISESSWSTSIAPYLHLSANWCWLNQFPHSQKTLDSLKLTHCIPSVEFYVTRISDLTETQKLEFYPNPRTMPAFLLCIYLPKKAAHVTTPGQKKAHLSGTHNLKTIHPCTPFLKILDKPFFGQLLF